VKKLLLILGACFFSGAFSLWAAKTDQEILIRILVTTNVTGPQICLGDVADVIGQNSTMVDRIRRLNLSRAASAGDKVKISQSLVKIALRKEGYSLSNFNFTGAPMAEVFTRSQNISTEDLLTWVKAFVLKEMKENPDNVQVKLGGPEKKITLPAGDIKTTFRPPLSGKYEGTLLITTELEVNNHLVKVLPLRVVVTVQHAVAVAKKRIEKGEKLTTENAGMMRVSTAKIPPDALRHIEIALGRTAAILLVPGAVLRIGSLYDPPVIRRGQLAQGLMRKGNVEITVEVRAVEDGKAGDSIRVQNTKSQKVLRARVEDEKTVSIEDRTH
jgi:flagellar basal body P-ring formation protein FlgA